MKSFALKYLFAALISACFVTPLTYAAQPPVTVAQPVDVKVVNPVAVTGTVGIGNTVQIAGKVETINDALKIPFHLTVQKEDVLRGIFYTVPVGMRLTIESVSTKVLVPLGQRVSAMLVFPGETVGTWSEANLALQPQGPSYAGGFDIFVMSQNLKIILDSTSRQIGYEFERSSYVGSFGFTLTIHGYLEELP